MSNQESAECPGCGSSVSDREDYRKRHDDESIPTTLSECPHCGTLKCCMCDAGDDTECISCPKE